MAVRAVLLVLLATQHAWALWGSDRGAFPGWRGEQDILSNGAEDQWRGDLVRLSWSPRAFLLKDFLSDEECEHLIELAQPHLTTSRVVDRKTGKSVPSAVRTSQGAFLARKQDDVVSAIEKRVSQVTMVPEENQEDMQILRYVDGQQYRPHWDYLNDKLHTDPARGGQRFVTVLMYLTTVDEGGETVFPRAEVGVTGPEWSECARQGNAVKARRGDAVMFFAMNPDGSEDPASLHGSCPTTQGTKWSATKWVHVAPYKH